MVGLYLQRFRENQAADCKMSKIIGAVEIGTSYTKALIGEVSEDRSLNIVGKSLRRNEGMRKGEIVGIAGLVGAGRTEMLQTLFGVTPALEGAVEMDGQVRLLQNARDAIQCGLALVPEDRKQQGLVLEMAVKENMSLASLRRDQHRGFLNRNKEQAICDEMMESMHIKTPSDMQQAQYLSGGNQQKVVLGKWLAMRPKVLLLDEPTRGIDVGAKQDIYRLMEQLAEEGVAILFVSSEMEEIIGMSDRALVMHEGRLSGSLKRHELNEESVMQLATGSDRIADSPAA